MQAVRASFSCAGGTLQAKGLCKTGRGSQSASCGPSYEYQDSIGQCRQIFETENLPLTLLDDEDDNN